MSKTKMVFASIGIVVGMFAFVFVVGLYSLGWKKFFLPKHENINREVFEQTQSFVHGKIQDLAKYMDEYNTATKDDKEAIRQIIILRFAEFDESKITSPGLKKFLVTMRGY